MDKEIRGYSTSRTPMLDSLIGSLPPPSLDLIQVGRLIAVTEARERLSQQIQAGTLTQTAIKQELHALPNVGGIEEGKMQLLRFVQMNVPGYDIKKLPVE